MTSTSSRVAAALVAAVLLGGCSGGPLHERDAKDAGKFALTYAKRLRHAGETLQGGGCDQVPEGSEHYDCHAVFLPSERTVCFKLTITGDGYRVSDKRAGRRFNFEDISGACRNR